MIGIPLKERNALGALLDRSSQEEVMARIPQFHAAETENLCAECGGDAGRTPGVLMFNMERGVNLKEIVAFLRECPDVRPFDIILANELDDGCFRSGNRNTAREIAAELGMNYCWGLEFIELVDERNEKGFHGNAIFSRYPIRRAGVIRLPEQYNWYFDRQRRIGGRLAVWAELDLGGKSLGVVTIHLENRTDGAGRAEQMRTILEETERLLPGMPLILGGDLNTNTFDGRAKDVINEIAGSPELQRKCLEEVDRYEPLIPEARAKGFRFVPETPEITRRKPLPGGGFLGLRLDWILLKGVQCEESRMIPTSSESFTYAAPDSPLHSFQGAELSDHNAVWARCVPEY